MPNRLALGEQQLLTPGGPPGVFAFSPRLDMLFARGWPYLRVLSDEPVTLTVARREARKASRAVDPYLPTVVPREIARRVLSAYPFHPFQQPDEVKAAVAAPVEVDEALMSRILRDRLSQVGETYDFRIREVLFLLEAYLGTEAVVSAVVEHCVAALDLKRWSRRVAEVDSVSAGYARVALALPWLRHRLPAARWSQLTSPMLAGNPRLPTYTAVLRACADDSAPIPEQVGRLGVSLARRDLTALRAHVARWPTDWVDAQLVYALGHDFLTECDVSKLRGNPKWKQERTLAEIGAIRAPGTLRVIAALLSSRSVAETAHAWVERHAEWIESEGLPLLSSWPHARAETRAIRDALRGGAQVTPPRPAALRSALRDLFEELPARMKACAGDIHAERAGMRAAFETYCELNAALGAESPDAFFTHELDLDWRAPKADVERWIELAVSIA